MSVSGLVQLLDQYRGSRDDAAMAELVLRTRPRLLRVACRIVPADLAEDCVQLAYLSLVRDRGEDFRPKVLPWLVSATVRIAYAAKAKERRQRGLARRLEHAIDDRVERDDLSRLVRERVDALPALYRDAVVLHHLEGLSVREVAGLLGLATEATKKRIQRGRTLLRARLHPRLIASALLPLWWLTDQTGRRVGGIVVKKKLAGVTVVLLLALFMVGASRLFGSSGSAPRRTTRSEVNSPSTTEQDSAPETQSYFLGRVVDVRGSGVPHATVRIRGTDREVRSSAGGSFRIPTTQSEAQLVARHDGLGDVARASSDVPCILELRRAETMQGVVVDPDGAPIVGATVIWRGAHMKKIFERSARSDAEGRFALPLVPLIAHLGASWIEILADGYAAGTFPELDGSDEFVLTRGAFVEGIVRYHEGEPIADVHVEFVVMGEVREYARAFFGDDSPWKERVLVRTSTGPDGRYQLGPIPARGYGDAVSGRAGRRRESGHVRVHVAGAVPADWSVRVAEPGELIHRDILVYRAVRFAGSVRDDRGRPIADARVTLENAEDELVEARVRSDGSFELLCSALEATGDLSLRIEPPARFRSEVVMRRRVRRGESIGAIVLELGSRPSIPFRVVSRKRSPIADARITLSQDRFLNTCYYHVFTDERGEARLDDAGTVAGTHHAYIEAKGFAPMVVGPFDPFAVREPIVVTLEPSRTLTGNVVWRDGMPAARVYVDATTTEASARKALHNSHRRQPAHLGLPPMLHFGSAQADGAGHFELTQLPPGPCRVIVRAYLVAADGHHQLIACSEKEVESGARDVSFVLKNRDPGKLRTIRGRVLAEGSEEPIRDFAVRLVRGERAIQARIIRRGVFQLEDVPGGVWQLDVTAPGFESVRRVAFDADAGDANFELRHGVCIHGQLRGHDIDFGGLKVSFVRSDGVTSETVRVKPDGTFSTSDLQSGTWFVRIRGKNTDRYAPARPRPIKIGADVRARSLDLEIVLAGILDVMTPDIKAGRYTIRATDLDGRVVYEVTEKRPLFRIPLPPSTYLWEAIDKSGRRGGGKVTLSPRNAFVFSIPKK